MPRRKAKPRSNAARLAERDKLAQLARLGDPDHGPIIRQQIAKSRRESTELALARAACKDRARGMCEANWEGVCKAGPHYGNQAHHMQLRSQGGPDQLWNLLWVCQRVHHHAHDVDRAGAEARGIIKRGNYVAPTGPALGDWPTAHGENG